MSRAISGFYKDIALASQAEMRHGDQQSVQGRCAIMYYFRSMPAEWYSSPLSEGSSPLECLPASSNGESKATMLSLRRFQSCCAINTMRITITRNFRFRICVGTSPVGSANRS